MNWGAVTGTASPVTYNIYRGSLTSLFGAKTYDHGCFMSGLTTTSISFVSLPDDSYFLVSARSAGYGEGSPGVNSAGVAIPNAASCP